MLVTLIKKNYIHTLALPEKIRGKFWIQDLNADLEHYDLISIEAKSNQWEIQSNPMARVWTDEHPVKSVTLVPDRVYDLEVRNEPEKAVLFTEKSTKDRQTFRRFCMEKDCTLRIGRSPDNDIVYDNSLVSSHHTDLTWAEGKWVLSCKNSMNGTFVNNRLLKNDQFLQAGNVIYIMGMKIIVGDGFFAINNPDHLVRLNSANLTELCIEYSLFPENTEEQIYAGPHYFYRSPRFKRDVECVRFQIDAPPKDQIGDEVPFIMTLGPSLTMGMASVVTGGFTVTNAIARGDFRSAIPSMVMSGSMLLGTVLWPVISRSYERKKRHEREHLRQTKYTQYLQDMDQQIQAEIQKQRAILKENSVLPQECIQRILHRTPDLWERNSTQNDFLQLRLGMGTLPLQADISYQGHKFSLEEDHLLDKMFELCDAPKNLENVPISMSLIEHPITGVIGRRSIVCAFVKGMILQLTALYAYDEVKCVFLYDESEEDVFSFVKWLPHVWDDAHSFRMIATNHSELKEVSTYLTRIVESRSAGHSGDGKTMTPYYVVFALSRTMALRADVLKNIYASQTPLNICVLNCFDELKNLPKECSTVIDLTEEKGRMFDKNDVSGKELPFLLDTLVYQDLLPVATELANISLDLTNGTFNLPKMITFLDLFGVGKVEYLNVLSRWQDNDPTKSLEAPVGINTLGDTFLLDLHEKFHGPHGLVAGMTGSGKSEFIITYILSMAVNYNPSEVAFLLIDYKGGGMAKSFEKLPHTAGIITDLDGAAIKRSLISIESELKRREAIFRETSKSTGISNIDIYKYQKLYRQGTVSEPLQHLFIISDEFAELKTQQPEFMEKLVSAARIGRSLGVHLILATQKPSGVVDDQIWSNSKFRVCLKVQDVNDSNDMLKRPEAAGLSDTGRFYLQVGYNELFELGQSAWSGAPYYPSEMVSTRNDESITVIDRTGRPLKIVKCAPDHKKIKNPKKQLDAVTEYLARVAREEGIHIRKLWLDPIPGKIYLDEIRDRYHVRCENRFELEPLIGELDDPYGQRQLPVTVPISREGNVVLFGSAGSGKTMFLNALIYSLLVEHTPDEVNLYLLDFGAETLKAFADAPHVGDVLLEGDAERIDHLFQMLQEEVSDRKKIMSEVGGDYSAYTRRTEHPRPNLVIVIQNYTAFKELYEDYVEKVSFLTREGIKYGIYFVISAVNVSAIGFRMLQNFGQLLTMQLNDESEYSSVVGRTDGMVPAKFQGRGLIRLDKLYEFQTAMLSREMDASEYIRRCCEVLRYDWTGSRARRIPVLPERVDPEFMERYYDASDPMKIPVGVNTVSMQVEYVSLNKRCITLVSSEDDSHEAFMKAFLSWMAGHEIRGTVFDPAGVYENPESPSIDYIRAEQQCNERVHALVLDLVHRNNAYKQALADGSEPEDYPVQVVVLESLSGLFDTLSEDEKDNLGAALLRDDPAYHVYFVLSDNSQKFMRYSFEKWFKNQISGRDFLWLGSGVHNQMQLHLDTVTAEMRTAVEPGFGFLAKNGKAVKIKALTVMEEDT